MLLTCSCYDFQDLEFLNRLLHSLHHQAYQFRLRLRLRWLQPIRRILRLLFPVREWWNFSRIHQRDVLRRRLESMAIRQLGTCSVRFSSRGSQGCESGRDDATYGACGGEWKSVEDGNYDFGHYDEGSSSCYSYGGEER